MVDDPPAHAAVVILVLNAHAPARILDSARDDAVVVMVFEVIPVDDFPAWSGLTLEAAVCVHAFPSFRSFLGYAETPNADTPPKDCCGRGCRNRYSSRAGNSGDRGVTRVG